MLIDINQLRQQVLIAKGLRATNAIAADIGIDRVVLTNFLRCKPVSQATLTKIDTWLATQKVDASHA